MFFWICLRINFERKHNSKTATLSQLTFNRQSASHLFDKLLNNRHTKTCSAITGTCGLNLLRKRSKQAFLYKFLWHTNTCILDFKFASDTFFCSFNGPHTHANRTIRLIIFHTVWKKIHQYLFQIQRITPDIYACVVIMFTCNRKSVGFCLKGQGSCLCLICTFCLHQSFF